jgi:hypothetical protein
VYNLAVSDENKPPSVEELWEMVKVFSQHVAELKELLASEREKNKALDAENSGWLAVYQRFLSQIDALEAELSQLRSPREKHSGGS